ncbi:hypothetical protein WJX73_010040 [Symbiochloris irregularis]|uniref:Protein kinase domain-containing protein n=1 Tax=Symbiochloris irregularis TaxID=706552 RepID=A0AAW1PMP4_9CHLO
MALTEFSQLQVLKQLNLSRNKLASVPEDLGQLAALEDLDLSHNQLQSVPAALGNLTNLRYLNLMANQLTELPASIGNQLTSLPDSLGNMTGLVKLQASFNKIQTLTASISQLQKLELMRLAVNDLQDLPKELAQLNSLAWVSLAGNPMCPVPTAPTPPMQTLDTLQDLGTGEALGDGASGDVVAATWQGSAVAVKVFRADVSPDGRSVDEIAVATRLDHPNLVRVRAKVASPSALVVDRVFGTPLAAKPNHASLLRCRWDADTTFAPGTALSIVLGIARALEYLHSLNICHGDLYAHNVLADKQGHAVLCDFGASFFYKPEDTTAFEAQEVRAFGLFLKDINARLDSQNEDYQSL